MIIAGEFHDQFAAREAAGQSQGAHRGFGAGTDQPHALDRRHGGDDQLGQFAFRFGRSAEAGASLGGGLHRGDDSRRRVPQNQRAPRADVVDVAIAVEIVEIGARRRARKKSARRRRRRTPGPGYSRRRA